MNKPEPAGYFGALILIVIGCLMFLPLLNWVTGYWTTCHIKSMFSSDKYCYGTYLSNLSDSGIVYQVRSHEADLIAEQQYNDRQKAETELAIKERLCYDSGYDFNKTFDIIKDYGLSCIKIDYINSHLVNTQVNGGYIEGSYSGLFSYGHIEGNFDIIKESLATGKLIENISYHVNCRNESLNTQINYYDESEFVLYYMERCL